MNRLTEKRWYGFYGYEVYETYPEDIEKVNDKLGQAEDIEEKHDMSLDEMDAYITSHKQIEKEIGIDLIILFKALKNGVWVFFGEVDHFLDFDDGFGNTGTPNYKRSYHYINTDQNYLSMPDLYELEFKLEGKYYQIGLEDYGKTWALTKEELEQKQ